jgi:hypothetical protein
MTTDDEDESPPPSAFIKFLTQPWEDSSPTARAITYLITALILGGTAILLLVHG